ERESLSVSTVSGEGLAGVGALRVSSSIGSISTATRSGCSINGVGKVVIRGVVGVGLGLRDGVRKGIKEQDELGKSSSNCSRVRKVEASRQGVRKVEVPAELGLGIGE
ncbi:15559_t:CDS:2, partial [Gigaspora margarita]